MEEADASLQEDIFHKKVKKCSKTNYIDFYHSLLEVIENYTETETQENDKEQFENLWLFCLTVLL